MRCCQTEVQMSGGAVPATKIALRGSQSAVPATKSALRGSQSAVPATKSALRGSQSAVPATKCTSKFSRSDPSHLSTVCKNAHGTTTRAPSRQALAAASQILRACAVEMHIDDFEKHKCTVNSSELAGHSRAAQRSKHSCLTITVIQCWYLSPSCFCIKLLLLFTMHF